MPGNTHWKEILVLATLPLQATAIQLDCQDNGDGTYICVEINHGPGSGSSSPALTEAVQENAPYIEEAKKECTYKEPRKRSGKSGSSAARIMEKQKSARQEYERCLAQKAHEIRKSR